MRHAYTLLNTTESEVADLTIQLQLCALRPSTHSGRLDLSGSERLLCSHTCSLKLCMQCPGVEKHAPAHRQGVAAVAAEWTTRAEEAFLGFLSITHACATWLHNLVVLATQPLQAAKQTKWERKNNVHAATAICSWCAGPAPAPPFWLCSPHQSSPKIRR